LGDAFRAKHKAPRRAIHAHGPRLNSSLSQSFLKQRAEILECALNHPVRNLFDTNFQEERKTHCRRSSFFSISATFSSSAESLPAASKLDKRSVALASNLSRF